MISSFSNSYSFSSKPSLVDDDEWVESMRKSIAENNEDITNIPVSIFTVPKILVATHPDSYIPHQVALGPFHHWRPEVYDMQRYKLAAARRTQQQMNLSFERIVQAIHKSEARIRACYHKFLDMNGDALAWMIAVDMAFLLEFLQVYFMRDQGRTFKKLTSDAGMSHVVDLSGKKLSHVAILRDLVMVENQIPLFVVKTMLEHLYRETGKSAEEALKIMLMGLHSELSPFHQREPPSVDVNDCDHLLDFLYHMTVPNNMELGIMETSDDTTTHDHIYIDGQDFSVEEESFAKPSQLRKLLDYMWKILSKTNAGVVILIKKIIFAKPITLVMKLPWKVISRLPVVSLIKEPVEHMFANFQGKQVKNSKDGASTNSNPPLMEEITIPSVTEMDKAGIFVSPVNGGIFDMSFDDKTSTLYLPVVELDINTEVHLRNLVAYEACVAAGPLVVARYTELMNGIIDTEEDAKYLREKGVVLNHLKSDKEVAEMWNGMSKCVKMTKVGKMDKVIEDVNKRYGKTWRVKMRKFMKTYVFGSWKFLTLLAALFLLFLTTLQAFCSVYSCARVFRQLPDLQGSQATG